MQVPEVATNHAEQAIADYRLGACSLGEVIQHLLPTIVHIPMDRPPIVDEAGNSHAGESLCLQGDAGEVELAMVTSYAMFAAMAEEYPQFSRVFADHPLETVLHYARPDFGFVINPRTDFELRISAACAQSLRTGSVGASGRG